MPDIHATAEFLENLSAQVQAADAGDLDEIVQIAIALRKVLDDYAVSDESKELLEASLSAIQGLAEQTLPAKVLDHIAMAVTSVREHLSDPPEREPTVSPTEALQGLHAVMSGAASGAAESSEQVSSPSPETINVSEQSDAISSSPACEALAVTPDAPEPASDGAAPYVLPTDTDTDLLREFIVECLDHVTAAEASLLDLEARPDDTELINTIFRAFHTIKGTSGFLGLDRIQELSHLAENLLNRGRDGQIQIRGGYADLALKSCDLLRVMIEELRSADAGQELPVPAGLQELLTCLSNPDAHGVSDEVESESLRVGDILVGRGATDRESVERAAADASPGQKIGQVLMEAGSVRAEDVASALRTQKKSSGVDLDATIRVGTTRLDSLIDMVGELVIAQSMVAQDRTVSETTQLTRKVAHANKIVRELQDLAMSLRMVPLRGTFQKMARLVRDLGRKSGKSVQFICEGEGTEIDRSMVESLGDPLVHMIRNCVDHGIESAEDRTKAGKNARGTVTLRAYHAAGKVVIELRDDGRGLNRDKILAKAIEKGIVPAGREIPENEIFALIFRAGFSTADKITDISGRGVGMDVVRKGIDALRGQIDVASRPGEGTTITLRLPLTMAITDAMLVRVGRERYLLPTISIEHSFRPEPGSVMTVKGGLGEMVQLRGQLLPVLRLHRLFHVPDAITEPTQGLLIVLEGHVNRCALMVDELLDQQQVVIKTLGRMFADTPGVAGGAILGDGRVGLILDASSLVDMTCETATQSAA